MASSGQHLRLNSLLTTIFAIGILSTRLVNMSRALREPAEGMAMAARIWIVAASVLLTSCVATQLSENLMNAASEIDILRERQVLDNLSVAIDQPDAVPSQLVVSTGLANNVFTGGLSAVLPNWNLSHNSGTAAQKTLTPSVMNMWQTNWNMSLVSDPHDLSNLRALYGLLYRSDKDIAQIIFDTGQLYGTLPEQLLMGCGVRIDPNTSHHKFSSRNWLSSLI